METAAKTTNILCADLPRSSKRSHAEAGTKKG